MTREEIKERFNALPRKHRTTIIGNEIDQEIRWIEKEKRNFMKEYCNKIKQYNNRIKELQRLLNTLNDDSRDLCFDDEILSEKQLNEIILHLDEYASRIDKYCFGLPTSIEHLEQMRGLILRVIQYNKILIRKDVL